MKFLARGEGFPSTVDIKSVHNLTSRVFGKDEVIMQSFYLFLFFLIINMFNSTDKSSFFFFFIIQEHNIIFFIRIFIILVLWSIFADF